MSFAKAQYNHFLFDGNDRTYLVHLPSQYSNEEIYPLVIAMHGGFGSAENMQNQSRLSIKADAENFIVVYPEGVKGGVLDIRTWNAGWCCGYASNSNVDDVGFINALLDTLISHYSIDTTRIYATGMSNGGFMAYRLACELSDRIAAIAPVSASMSLNDCEPSRAVPIIHFHSYSDTNVPYKGGVGNGVSNHYNSPIDSVINAWANFNSCMLQNDTIFSDNSYTHIVWDSCECNSEIELYITEDGGHSWPGGQQTLVGDPASEYINANDLMWTFFQNHTLQYPAKVGVHHFSGVSREEKFYPNPTTGEVNFNLPTGDEIQRVVIRSLSGRSKKVVSVRGTANISDLPNGVYLISVFTKNHQRFHKIIRKQ